VISQTSQLNAAAWMITYLLHSTVLLAAVWALSRALRHRQECFIEMLWRFALIAPVLTASLQLGLSIRPLTGVLPAPERIVSDSPSAPGLPDTLPASLLSEADAARDAPPAAEQLDDAPSGRHPDADTDAIEDRAAEPVFVEAPAQSFAFPGGGAHEKESMRSLFAAVSALDSSAYLLGVTAVIGLALLVATTRSIAGRVRLRAMMRDREAITHGPAATVLQRLQRRSSLRRRVRLTSSNRLTVPIAFGVLRSEICLPACVLRQFGPAELESVLAHELAHHVRHDPAWQALTSVLEGLLFFQPLNVIACRRLRELAELACDTWAAEQTGDRVTLAKCLTEVAGWIVQRQADPALRRAMGMAGSSSALRQRILRLLDDAPRVETYGVRRWFCALSPLLLALTAWAVPGVGAPSRDAALQAPQRATAVDYTPLQQEQGAPLVPTFRALLDDFDCLDTEICRLRAKAARLPLEALWTTSIDELTARAQVLRGRSRRFHDALRSASGGAAQGEVGNAADDDQLDS
jgi:beta-lactamase regulating signal transducer with metallopeptidase domain